MTSALLSARIHAPLAASSASPRGAGRARRLRARGARRAAPVAFAAVVDVEQKCDFAAVPERWFALDQLTVKGPRSNVDIGDPHDAGRPFVKGMQNGASSCGSWACSEGGWDSPNPRGSTEWFYVLSGNGAVTDPDGTMHAFGPGDSVVLPKGWHGRWDIGRHIHKVWLTMEHDDVAGASKRPVVVSQREIQAPIPAVGKAGNTIYDVGSVRAGSWSCGVGAAQIAPRNVDEVFFVIEGTFFLTDVDGASARRCSRGDFVHLPAGWTGTFDGIEPVVAAYVDVGELGAAPQSAPRYTPPPLTGGGGGGGRGGGADDELYDPDNSTRTRWVPDATGLAACGKMPAAGPSRGGGRPERVTRGADGVVYDPDQYDPDNN